MEGGHDASRRVGTGSRVAIERMTVVLGPHAQDLQTAPAFQSGAEIPSLVNSCLYSLQGWLCPLGPVLYLPGCFCLPVKA